MESIRDIHRQVKGRFHAQRDMICLSLIILSGTVLRLYDLGTESFWFDEMCTVYLVRQDLQTLVRQFITQGDAINAVYYLSAHFWVLSFGITEVSIRSLSVIFGVLSIGIMYLVGQQLFGTKVGLISAFMMTVSELQIQYSQDARFYSLFVLLTLASLYSYILALKTKQQRFWFVSLLINLLLYYTHTYAIFVFAAEYIHYLIYWKHNKDTIVQWGVSQVLLILTIIISFISMFSGGGVASLDVVLSWITTPSFKDLLRIIYDFLFPQNYQHSWLFIGTSFAAGLAFLLTGTLFVNFRKGKDLWWVELKGWFRNSRFLSHIDSELVLVALWFICPIILPFIYSNIFRPILVDRYAICAAPAVYLLVAIAISRVSRVVPIYISLIALMIVILPGLQDYYAADVNEQWRDVAAYVQENSSPKDAIVFTPDDEGFQHKSFDWYYQGNLSYCGISSGIKDDQEIAYRLSSCTLGHERFWLILRGNPKVVDHFKSFFLNPNQISMHLVKKQEFVKVSVYLFELTK